MMDGRGGLVGWWAGRSLVASGRCPLQRPQLSNASNQCQQIWPKGPGPLVGTGALAAGAGACRRGAAPAVDQASKLPSFFAERPSVDDPNSPPILCRRIISVHARPPVR